MPFEIKNEIRSVPLWKLISLIFIQYFHDLLRSPEPMRSWLSSGKLAQRLSPLLRSFRNTEYCSSIDTIVALFYWKPEEFRFKKMHERLFRMKFSVFKKPNVLFHAKSEISRTV